jgi:undecaprenyl-diphosphatase
VGRPNLDGVAAAIGKLDRRMFDAVVARRSRTLDRVLVPAAFTGAGGLPWIGLILLLRFGSRRGGSIRPGRDSAAVLLGFGAAQVLKRVRDRERPCHGREPLALVDCPSGSSMPSDQAASAFAGAAVLTEAFPEARAAFYGLASLTAAARLYAGVHYPSDVVVGAIIGHLAGRISSVIARA